MAIWAPIQYREFWDIPRIFIAPFQGRTLLFDCRFDEVLGDFPAYFKVFLLPHLDPEELAGSWDDLGHRAIQFIGNVPIEKVRFDPSKRRQVNTALLKELLNQADTDAAKHGRAADQHLLKERIDEVLRSLSPHEREVIELRFGLRDGHPRTLDEVAQTCGIASERIRQIEARGLVKLRKPNRSQGPGKA
jgi:RNA polymerase sigma factor (sigma-70 family)